MATTDNPWIKDTSGRLWWCNIHRRRAEYVEDRHGKVHHYCGPLGGIMLTCEAVDLTDELEIWDDKNST